MSEWEIEQIRNSIAEQQYVHSPHPELSGGSSGGGTGGLDTSIHTRENLTCRLTPLVFQRATLLECL